MYLLMSSHSSFWIQSTCWASFFIFLLSYNRNYLGLGLSCKWIFCYHYFRSLYHWCLPSLICWLHNKTYSNFLKVSIFETFERENSPFLYDKPRNWQSTILHYYVSPVPYFHSIRKAHLIAYFFLLKALLTYIAYIFRIYKNMHIFYLIQSYH